MTQNRDIKARIESKRETIKREMLLRKGEQKEVPHSARPNVELESGSVGFGDVFFVPELGTVVPVVRAVYIPEHKTTFRLVHLQEVGLEVVL